MDLPIRFNEANTIQVRPLLVHSAPSSFARGQDAPYRMKAFFFSFRGNACMYSLSITFWYRGWTQNEAIKLYHSLGYERCVPGYHHNVTLTDRPGMGW